MVEGIVGVPRPPENDLERNMLAYKLSELVEAPDIGLAMMLVPDNKTDDLNSQAR